MIKRPILVLLVAYLIGILTSYHQMMILFYVLIFLFLIFYILCSSCKVFSRYLNSYDKVILLVPACFVLGFLLCYIRIQPNLLDVTLNDKVECAVVGKIKGVEYGQTSTIVTLNKVQIAINNRENQKETVYGCSKLVVYLGDKQEYRVGNLIKVSGTLMKFKSPTNFGQFNEQRFQKIKGIDYKMKAGQVEVLSDKYSVVYQWLQQIKKNMTNSYTRSLDDKDQGVIVAMLLGDKRYLSQGVKESYQKNGIAHILAISGLHISFLGLTFFRLLRKGKMGVITSTMLTIIVISCYGVLTGFSVSTNRAVVMLVISLVAKIIGKTYDIPCAMAWSAFIILLQNPLQLFSSGFLLSYGAIVGIIAVYAPIFSMVNERLEMCIQKKREAGEAIEDKKSQYLFIKDKILSPLLVSICIQVITLPIILSIYYEFPLYAVFLNLLVLPMMSLIVGLAMVAGIVGCFAPILGIFLCGGVHDLLFVIESLCRLFERLPCATIVLGKPKIVQIILYYTCVCGLVLISNRKKVPKLNVCLIVLPIIFCHLPSRQLEVTMLDVGQGDGIYMSYGGKSVLVDGGSTSVNKVGNYRILPFLKAKGSASLDYMIVSHMDEDHINGLKEIIASDYRIKHILLPNTSMKDDAYMEFFSLAKEDGIKVSYLKTGDIIKLGDLSLLCLHPSLEDVPKSRNEYSTVLWLKLKEFQMLFTGDLEGAGESEVLQVLKTMGREETCCRESDNVTVLKVGHHGSKNSTNEEFLNLIRPKYSIISAGKHNVYGHPNKELLQRLDTMDSRTFVTIDNGAITITTDGKRMKIKTFVHKK